jgi:hypothetical protein
MRRHADLRLRSGRQNPWVWIIFVLARTFLYGSCLKIEGYCSHGSVFSTSAMPLYGLLASSFPNAFNPFRSNIFAFSSSDLLAALRPRPARLMKYVSMRMPDSGPFGETFFEARLLAIVSAFLVNSPLGGFVESVLTLDTHRFFFAFAARIVFLATSSNRFMCSPVSATRIGDERRP